MVVYIFGGTVGPFLALESYGPLIKNKAINRTQIMLTFIYLLINQANPFAGPWIPPKNPPVDLLRALCMISASRDEPNVDPRLRITSLDTYGLNKPWTRVV